MSQGKRSPEFVLQVMAQVNGALEEAAREVRSRPGVARALHECDVRGSEHGSEFLAYMEVHSERGPYACYWFEFGHTDGQWTVEAAVHTAAGVGEPTTATARIPDVKCANLEDLKSASRAAVAWLVARARSTDYLRLE